MEKIKPTISVILPVYNGGNYLQSCIESVLVQNLTDFELLILDDCSSDESWKYIENLVDSRVTALKNETNKGLFFNLNYLIKKCSSGLIKLWSQDDMMYPHCLEAFVHFHNQFPSLGFSYCGRDIIDENGRIKEQLFIDETPQLVSSELHARIAFFTGSIAGNIANVCLNKKALDEVGLFDETMKISGDFDMWVRLAENHNTGFIAEKLIQLRDHSRQLSRNELLYLNHVVEDLEVYRKLKSYVSPSIAREGTILMRKHKLVFYYTLMLKALLKGKIKSGYAFFKELSRFDNFFILTFYFIRSKIIKPKAPSFS